MIRVETSSTYRLPLNIPNIALIHVFYCNRVFFDELRVIIMTSYKQYHASRDESAFSSNRIVLRFKHESVSFVYPTMKSVADTSTYTYYRTNTSLLQLIFLQRPLPWCGPSN